MPQLDTVNIPDTLEESGKQERFLHREEQRDKIMQSINPLLDGNGKPTNVLAHGSPGTGKTTVINQLGEDLQENTDIQILGVNCVKCKSTFDVMYGLIDEKLAIPRTGTSTSELIDKLDKKVRVVPTVIILEEVEEIPEDALYHIFRYMDVPVIMTSENPEVEKDFGKKIESRMTGLNKVEFTQYSREELLDILKLKASEELRKDAVTEEALNTILDNLKDVGDARKPIQNLRLIVQKAENEEIDQVTAERVEKYFENNTSTVSRSSPGEFNEEKAILLKTLIDLGTAKMGEIFRRYREEADMPKSRRTIRMYLKDLDEKGFVEKKGKKRGTKYGSRLSDGHSMVLDLLDTEERMRIGEVLEKHREESENPKSRKTIQRKLRDLCDHNLVEKIGEKSSTKYRQRF